MAPENRKPVSSLKVPPPTSCYLTPIVLREQYPSGHVTPADGEVRRTQGQPLGRAFVQSRERPHVLRRISHALALEMEEGYRINGQADGKWGCNTPKSPDGMDEGRKIVSNASSRELILKNATLRKE